MKIILESNLEELKRVRRNVREAALSLPNISLDEESIGELELAVTEAIANIIEHAYHGEKGKKIEFIIEGFADGIQVVFHHWGKSFDPAAVPPPVFDITAEGGFGLYIISNCVDFVGYATDESSRNTIRLIKNSRN